MAESEISTKPYLLRALYEWCLDNGFTPHVAVKVDAQTQVPAEYVKGGEITLNISPTAVHKLEIGNTFIEFSARFGGVARQIMVPVSNVQVIYARETGQGMSFDVDVPQAEGVARAPSAEPKLVAPLETNGDEPPEPPRPSPSGRPALRRVK